MIQRKKAPSPNDMRCAIKIEYDHHLAVHGLKHTPNPRAPAAAAVRLMPPA